MLANYADILALSSEPPLWFNEWGVPRYIEFAPAKVANVYAKEAVLAEIGCQHCGRAFRVAFSSGSHTEDLLSVAITENSLRYGDPPDVGCCATGSTVHSEARRVLEYWTRREGHAVATEALHARLSLDRAKLLQKLQSGSELVEFAEVWGLALAAALEQAADSLGNHSAAASKFERFVWTRDRRLEVPIYPDYRIALEGARYD